MSLGYRKSSLEDERVRIPRHQATGEKSISPLARHSMIQYAPLVVPQTWVEC
jgi:hypothetical protein